MASRGEDMDLTGGVPEDGPDSCEQEEFAIFERDPQQPATQEAQETPVVFVAERSFRDRGSRDEAGNDIDLLDSDGDDDAQERDESALGSLEVDIIAAFEAEIRSKNRGERVRADQPGAAAIAPDGSNAIPPSEGDIAPTGAAPAEDQENVNEGHLLEDSYDGPHHECANTDPPLEVANDTDPLREVNNHEPPLEGDDAQLAMDESLDAELGFEWQPQELQRAIEVDTLKEKKQAQLVTFVICVVVLAVLVLVGVAVKRNPLRKKKIPANIWVSTYPPSSSPTQDFVPSLTEMLTPFSSLDAMTTPNTPQNNAIRYLSAFLEPSAIATTDPTDQSLIVQRYVMAVFYFAMGGDDWSSCGRKKPSCGTFEPWLVGEDVCSWHMVQCNDRQQIVSLRTGQALPRVGMQGTVPSELQHLSSIEVLELTDDKLEGRVLSYTSSMENLTALILSSNRFEGGIDEFLEMDHQKLSVLKLDHNDFEGTIPDSIGRQSLLETLDLSQNMFDGALPLTLYELSLLQTLELGDNEIVGTISPDIGNLSSLTSLSLGPSMMNGELPSELFFLSSLESLKLNDAEFSGPLKAESFSELTNLHVLYLYDNGFSGEIPVSTFEQYDEIQELRLEGNPALSGVVSEEICAKRQLKLYDLRVGCDNIICPQGCCTDRCI